jgi:hypothetical protein
MYTDILVTLLTKPCIALPFISLPFCSQHKNIYGHASVLKLWKLFGFEIYFPIFGGIEIMAKDYVLWAICFTFLFPLT